MFGSPQARNQGGESTLDKFSPPQEKCAGRILKLLHSLKNFSLIEKTLRPPWCPKLVTGVEVQQTFSFPFSLLRQYQMPECFCVKLVQQFYHATEIGNVATAVSTSVDQP